VDVRGPGYDDGTWVGLAQDRVNRKYLDFTLFIIPVIFPQT